MPGFRKLDGTEMNRLSVEHYAGSPKHPLYLVLHNIRSMWNVGSMFRTADAAGIEKMILSGYTATPPRKEIDKALRIKQNYFNSKKETSNEND